VYGRGRGIYDEKTPPPKPDLALTGSRSFRRRAFWPARKRFAFGLERPSCWRYFTVYGPRPAAGTFVFRRVCEALLEGRARSEITEAASSRELHIKWPRGSPPPLPGWDGAGDKRAPSTTSRGRAGGDDRSSSIRGARADRRPHDRRASRRCTRRGDVFATRAPMSRVSGGRALGGSRGSPLDDGVSLQCGAWAPARVRPPDVSSSIGAEQGRSKFGGYGRILGGARLVADRRRFSSSAAVIGYGDLRRPAAQRFKATGRALPRPALFAAERPTSSSRRHRRIRARSPDRGPRRDDRRTQVRRSAKGGRADRHKGRIATQDRRRQHLERNGKNAARFTISRRGEKRGVRPAARANEARELVIRRRPRVRNQEVANFKRTGLERGEGRISGLIKQALQRRGSRRGTDKLGLIGSASPRWKTTKAEGTKPALLRSKEVERAAISPALPRRSAASPARSRPNTATPKRSIRGR